MSPDKLKHVRSLENLHRALEVFHQRKRRTISIHQDEVPPMLEALKEACKSIEENEVGKDNKA